MCMCQKWNEDCECLSTTLYKLFQPIKKMNVNIDILIFIDVHHDFHYYLFA